MEMEHSSPEGNSLFLARGTEDSCRSVGEFFSFLAYIYVKTRKLAAREREGQLSNREKNTPPSTTETKTPPRKNHSPYRPEATLMTVVVEEEAARGLFAMARNSWRHIIR